MTQTILLTKRSNSRAKQFLATCCLLAGMLLPGLQASAQTYYQLSTVSGTETDGGVTVTITPFGSTDGSSFCGGGVSPYFTSSDGSGATYTFSTPVSSVQLPTQFGSNPPFATATYYINGSFYPLTSVNLLGMTNGECALGLAEISGGLLDNAVAVSAPSGIVQINGAITSITIVLNFAGPSSYASWGLFFAPATFGFDNGSPITSLICQNALPKDIGSLLAASDVGSGTLTWSVISGPSHGTLSGFPASAATGTSVTPSGTTYQPATGYTGPDAYTIQVTDGTTTATTTVNVTVGGYSPAVVAMSGGGGYCSGGIGLDVGLVGSAVGINYQLYHAGLPIGSPFTGIGYLFSFGLQTAAGNYTATATDPVSGCTVDMSGSENVIIYPLPNVYNVTGGGDHCSGGSGVIVGVDNSSLGINYQLYIGGVPILGAVVPGTGSAVSFAPDTAAGVYTVVAKNASFTGCISDMTGSATISIDPLPMVYEVTGGGSFCSGGDGVSIGLSSSDAGFNYQLYLGIAPIGSPIAGTGGALTFGTFATAGIYTVKATDATTGCTNIMTGSASITINPLPVAYTVTGGGGYCAGGPGVVVGLYVGVFGVNYQLYNGTTPVGSPVAGTGAGISYGLQTTPGTYTVSATSTLTGCSSNMSDSAIVSINPLPVVYGVIGGGGYCTGGPGVHVGLASSNTGILYQLWRGTTGLGSPVSGTGAAIDFGLQSIAGTYSVTATSVSTLCGNNMSGSVTVSVNPLPTVYSVTGGGAYCTGGTGATVGLSGSQTGVNYLLMRGITVVGTPVPGTGSAISFGAQTVTGAYTVVATDADTGCASNMTGSATVSITSPPTAYTVTGGGGYCSGGTGVSIGLSGSQAGISYQLFNSSVPSGSPVAGTGASITFGLRTAAGTYTVVASTSGGCTTNMSGSATVTVNTVPTVYPVTGGGSYCAGGTGVTVGLSNSATGVNYQLYRGTTLIGSAVPGTSGAISFGLQTVAGTYTVTATAAPGGCSAGMSGSATVSISTLPTVVSVTGGGGYCSGGTGVHVGLAASVTGINYQLWRSGSPIGSPVAGIGGALDFGLQTTSGTYTATATNRSSCTSTMSGSATVTVYAVPTIYSVTGGGSYCSGGTGVHVRLSGSAAGVTYKLYASGTPAGTMTGTGASLDFGLFTTAATYTITATNALGCTNAMTGSVTISVNPNPTITATPYTIAPGGTSTFTGSISGGSWTSSVMSVAAIGSATGVATGVSLGTTVITYTLPTGCYGAHVLLVTPSGHRESHPAASPTVTDSISNITVAPNPTHGTFSIKGSASTNEDKELIIQVTNMMGQVVYNNSKTINGEIDETIQLNILPNGMYLLTIRSNTDIKVVHLVIEN